MIINWPEHALVIVTFVGLALAWAQIKGELMVLKQLLGECEHCLHWMMTTHYGRTTLQTCCKCGRVVSTQVIETEEAVPWRPRDHGPYVRHLREKDRIA